MWPLVVVVTHHVVSMEHAASQAGRCNIFFPVHETTAKKRLLGRLKSRSVGRTRLAIEAVVHRHHPTNPSRCTAEIKAGMTDHLPWPWSLGNRI